MSGQSTDVVRSEEKAKHRGWGYQCLRCLKKGRIPHYEIPPKLI